MLNCMYMNRQQKLKQLIDDQFEGSQADFCRKAELQPAQVSQWLTGYRNLGEKAARKIELKLGLKLFWLDSKLGDNVEGDNFSPTVGLRGSVPLISWVQAGNWESAIDTLAIGEGERIETTYKANKHTYALRVQGDSMESKFPNGCIIIVEPEENPRPGQYVIVRQNGDDATFKQLIQDGSTLFLKPLNPRYPIMELRSDAVFCGVVKRMEMDV